MTKKTTKKSPVKKKTSTNGALIDPETRQNEAVGRAEACNAELSEVLRKYGCVIQPYIVPNLDPVGQMGDCAQISASYGIRALPLNNDR